MRRIPTPVIAMLLALLWTLPTSPADAGDGSDLSKDDALLLVAGQSRLVDLDERVERVVVVDPAIADAEPISANEILMLGRKPGSTDVVFKLESGEAVWRRLTVSVDQAGLIDRLRGLFGVDLQVEEYDGIVALRGSMPDVATAAAVQRFMNGTGMDWIDTTRIPGVRQVQLKVRIAEASRTALRELAFGGYLGGSDGFGGVQATTANGEPFQRIGVSSAEGLAESASNPSLLPRFGVSSATTLFGGVPSANLEVYLQALNENRYVRLLAEPNLVAVSGEEATFLVGGEFPIPVVQGTATGAGPSVTIEYKEFGVRLTFRPEVLGDGRIRLEVAPEVSELSDIGGVSLSGFAVPGVVTRRSSTTVELGSGQSFAMAGLLRTFEQARVSKVPGLGELPLLGVLFRSLRYVEEQTELVVMVTADLVEPIDDGMVRPVPGDLHTAPDDWELFIEGSLNGTITVGSPAQRLESLGLTGLAGPGAWRRSDDAKRIAADAPVRVPERAPSTEDAG